MVFIFLCLFGWHILHVHGKLDAEENQRCRIKSCIQPFFGWNAAIVSMFGMDAHKRKKLLGCVKERKSF